MTYNGVRWLCGCNIRLHWWSCGRLQGRKGVLGRKRQGMYLLSWGKLSVTALRVHHFSLRSNYSRFHLATLLCPPQCTMMETYDRTENQGWGLKAGKNCCWNATLFSCFFSLYIVDSHSAASNKLLQLYQQLCCKTYGKVSKMHGFIKVSGMNHYSTIKSQFTWTAIVQS